MPKRGVRRPGPFDGLYRSVQWKAFAKALIKERGRVCQDPACAKPDRGRGERMFCDHVIELKDGADPFDASLILLRCGSCHSRKTAAERLRRQGRLRHGRLAPWQDAREPGGPTGELEPPISEAC